ncbi:MAG: transcriptional regulator [Verrucomicrobia bacterium]|nr:transcriptional regulator [Verrucomicrobiota bacterium]
MPSGRIITTASITLATNGGFEQECVSFFAEVVQLFGVPKSVGQIYGLLYASPEPLGFPDIVERLDISKGSASQGLQLLRSLGAINEAERSSSLSNLSSEIKREARGVAYEPELSLRQLVTGVLRERIAPMATTGTDRLKRLKELAENSPANNKFYLGRAKQLETWRKRFTTVMPLLTALLGPKKKR